MAFETTSFTTVSTGWSLYEQAKAVIPGGTQLLSKRPEMFLPGSWPCYFQRAQGCRVWDLDGRELIDVSMSGIGTCLLGFADSAVDAAVKACIDRGTLCTLNDPIELTLAQRLLALHGWAQRVRYARCGGEAMAVAVRIARAATKRDAILFCGYHGWHDWYLAANLAQDRALDGHLLPGLEPAGVPRALRGSAVPFRYGQIDELSHLLEQHRGNVAAIVMEPMRYNNPPAGFLERVRALADAHQAVLVFDEVTSGWRYHLGGVHLKFGVDPDIAVFAKSLSNGYPMAAVIGRSFPMDAAQDSFISSTYWTESIGPTAALATIERMQELDVPRRLHCSGQQVREGWQRLIDKHQLPARIEGRPALMRMTFLLKDQPEQTRALATLLTQLMLERGFLATSAFYTTAAHDSNVVSSYLEALDEVFAVLHHAVVQEDVIQRLHGSVAHGGFQRLT